MSVYVWCSSPTDEFEFVAIFYAHFRYVVDFTDILYWKHLLQPLILVYAITISIFAYVQVINFFCSNKKKE